MIKRQINPFWLRMSIAHSPNTWRPLPRGWRDDFLAVLAEEKTIYRTAKRLGIARSTIHYHKTTDPDFAARLAAVLAGTSSSRKD